MLQRRIGELSGGQAQRVAIARSQVTGAPITFADEPTGALDTATAQEVMNLLLALDPAAGQNPGDRHPRPEYCGAVFPYDSPA